MITVKPTKSPLDPDIYDWCDVDRVNRFNFELKPIYKTLLWTNQFRSIAGAWVRRELSIELSESNIVWPKEVYSEKYEESRISWKKNNPDQSFSCDSQETSAWLLSDKLLLDWADNQWGHRLESLYLEKKQFLDVVSCSMLRVTNQNLAFELYQRIKSNEASLEQLSWKYAQGTERKHGGHFNKKRVQDLPKPLIPLLRNLKSGAVLKPRKIGNWFAVIILDEVIQAEFDDKTKKILLSQELNAWLHAVTENLIDQLE